MKQGGKYIPGGIVQGPQLAIVGDTGQPEYALTLEGIERAVQGMMEPKPLEIFVPPHRLEEAISEAKRLGMRADNIKPAMPLPIFKTGEE